MNRDQEFLLRWGDDRPVYSAWGTHLVAEVKSELAKQIAPLNVGHFLKVPPEPRLKDGQSLLTKAFYRNKNYTDPYRDITDKVGVRFVVLLGSQIAQIVRALTTVAGWEHSLDRDFEEEQKKNPIAFDYAAKHFIIRPAAALEAFGVPIPAGTPCEVQVKTLLQHSYSELTHDTLYKPQIDATHQMRRDAAKAMALLEATNDYFEKVDIEVQHALGAVRTITAALSSVYAQAVGFDPKPNVLEGLLLEAYEPKWTERTSGEVAQLLGKKTFLANRIRDRVSQSMPLFSQPSILLAYLDVSERGRKAMDRWPLTPGEMEPLLNDLGESRF